MNRKFKSEIEKPWLQKSNDESRERIYKLGIKAIDSLKKEETPVSYIIWTRYTSKQY